MPRAITHYLFAMDCLDKLDINTKNISRFTTNKFLIINNNLHYVFYNRKSRYKIIKRIKIY